MLAIGLYNVTKKLRNYNCSNRWLRRELIDIVTRKNRDQGWWTVLKDINIEIKEGETLAVLGRNGSGKSTLLKIMAGIFQPTAGRVIRQGSICTLFDVGTGFHEDLTGRENVFVNGAILGLSEKLVKSALADIEHFAELEGFMDTPLKFYSSGMKARLGFAVAMTADPDIFLIDEVLAVGDEGFKRKCYVKLDELVSKGRTVVIVSHDIEVVQRLCSRGIWIRGGVVQADGPIRDVCRDYLDYCSGSELLSNAS